MSSQGWSESSGEKSLLSVSSGSVDIGGEFRAGMINMKDMIQPKLEEVKEAASMSLEESAKTAMENEENKFFDELPEDMVDEGVSVGNMTDFCLIK